MGRREAFERKVSICDVSVLRKEKNCFFRKLKVTGSELSIMRKSSEGAGSQFLCGDSLVS